MSARAAAASSTAATGPPSETRARRSARPSRPPVRISPDDPLLRGCGTDGERRARRRLVRELLAAGVPRAELERAAREDRLVLLPAELVLTPRRYSAATLEKRTGLDPEILGGFLRASGLPRLEEITAGDVAAAKALRHLLDEGIPYDAALEIARVAGQGLASMARTIIRIVGDVYLRAGDGEYELAARYAHAANELYPLIAPLVTHQLTMHLREALRHATIGREQLASGSIQAAREVGVAFADLVGFTRLGTRVQADEIGRIAGRLVDLAGAVVDAPVEIAKTLGDAVMLVSPDVTELMDAVVALIDAVEREGGDFPQLRAGVAFGPAVPLGAEWYGHTVNLASRITAVARPGTVLATTEVRAATRGRFHWSRAMPRHFRGVRGPVFVARVRADGAAVAGNDELEHPPQL